MRPLFEGMIIGLTLAIMIGPALFTLIQTSVHRGILRGIILAFGIFLSDLTLVLLCIIGVLQILGDNQHFYSIGVIGGLILVAFGIFTFSRKAIISNNGINIGKQPKLVTYLVKGYLLNIVNPFVWLFWISLMVTISSGYNGKQSHILLFFTGTLITILITDIIKVLISSKLKQYLKPKVLIVLNHVVGILLVLFGIYLLINTMFKIY